MKGNSSGNGPQGNSGPNKVRKGKQGALIEEFRQHWWNI